MDKKALSPIVLPAIGVAGGGLAGLWATPERDTETTTAKMRKLLRCMALGGFTGIGADLMVRGGTGLANAMLSEKTGMYRKKIAKIQHIGRHLLRKEADMHKRAEDDSFTGYGALGDYGAGAGIGALTGLGLYGLLNDSKKRTGGGWLSAALTGAGLGAGGVGLYRNTSSDSTDTNNKGKSEPAPSLLNQVLFNARHPVKTVEEIKKTWDDTQKASKDSATLSQKTEKNVADLGFFSLTPEQQKTQIHGSVIRSDIGHFPAGSTVKKLTWPEYLADKAARGLYWWNGGVNPDGAAYRPVVDPDGTVRYVPPVANVQRVGSAPSDQAGKALLYGPVPGYLYSAGKATVRGAGMAAQKVVNGTKALGDGIATAANVAKQKVVNGAKAVGDGAVSAANTVSDSVINGINATGSAVNNGITATKEYFGYDTEEPTPYYDAATQKVREGEDIVNRQEYGWAPGSLGSQEKNTVDYLAQWLPRLFY